MPAKKTKIVNTYDWTITLKKFFVQMLIVAAVAALTWAVDAGLPDLILNYPEYAAVLALVSAIIVAIINYIKHYGDTAEVPE